MAKAAFDIRLEGYPPANRGATITLVNQATGQQVTRPPFLDGSLTIRDLDPGDWQMTVSHANLVNPIETRIVHLFPQAFPTFVPVIVRPDLFRDSAIRDIPDADLAPVQQAAAGVARSLPRVGGKSAGEVIRAEDWNVMVSAVSDLATSVAELTRIVSPQGHDHPEIAEKIGEVQGNILRFTESYGQSLLELRREIESQNVRRRLDDVLDLAGAGAAIRERIGSRIADMEASAQGPTGRWTSLLARQGTALTREVLDMANEQTAPSDFLNRPEVTQTLTLLQGYAGAAGQTKPEEELQVYRQSAARVGLPFTKIVG